ncbi:MAG: DinB family protein [Candidatus Thorarchaeota archaeon]|nr:DinB family protein [Candidatus Thorarchaeota archaeon]
MISITAALFPSKRDRQKSKGYLLLLMLYRFLVPAIERHLDEFLPFITQLNDDLIHKKPIPEGRALGEIVSHIFRSIEYYLLGVTEGVWEPAPYAFDEFTTADMLESQYKEVFTRAKVRLALISLSDLSRMIDTLDRRATVAEIILEMLEHSIHHRGKLTVYLRLLGVEPPKIEYII